MFPRRSVANKHVDKSDLFILVNKFEVLYQNMINQSEACLFKANNFETTCVGSKQKIIFRLFFSSIAACNVYFLNRSTFTILKPAVRFREMCSEN